MSHLTKHVSHVCLRAPLHLRVLLRTAQAVIVIIVAAGFVAVTQLITGWGMR